MFAEWRGVTLCGSEPHAWL